MAAAELLGTLISLTTAAIHMSEQAQKISLLLQKAQMENRKVSKEEFDTLLADDDVARAVQVAQLSRREKNVL